MSSIAAQMRSLRAEVFEDIGEVLLVGSERVPGKFGRRPREVPQGNSGSLVGIDMSFDCQTCPTVEALQRGDTVRIEYTNDAGVVIVEGPYRFERPILRAGDESGLVTLELGNIRA